MSFMSSRAHYREISLAPVWAGIAALLLAAGWLLPNHAFPWTAFHADAWVASVLGAVGLVVLYQTRGVDGSLFFLNLLTGIAFLVPLLQLWTGQLPYLGQAVMACLYLAGFLLAQLVGQRWQQWRSNWMGDILFGAIGFASLISVEIQIYQWAGLSNETSTTDIWVVPLGNARPFANLGQSNQLATLLLWGLLACAWGTWRGYLTRFGAMFVASFLLFGLALTNSRAGALGLALLVLCVWCFKPFTAHKVLRLISVQLGLIYCVLLSAIPWLSRSLLLDEVGTMKDRFIGESRPALWRMIADAISQQPWIGYGWNRVSAAHLSVADRHADVRTLVGDSHNLFLDLFVWIGLPLGIFFSIGLVAFLILVLRRLTSISDALYFLMLLVFSSHAMLELPHMYAYFLLPVGLVAGSLSQSLNIGRLSVGSRTLRNIGFTAYGCGVLLFCLTLRDYFRIESAVELVRFEEAHVKTNVPAKPPEILLLTQMRAQLAFFLAKPMAGATAEELQASRDITRVFPSAHNLMKLITLLVLNGHSDEAKIWMHRTQALTDSDPAFDVKKRWKHLQNIYSPLRGVEWDDLPA